MNVKTETEVLMRRLALFGVAVVLLGLYGEIAFTQQQDRAEQELLQLAREQANATLRETRPH